MVNDMDIAHFSLAETFFNLRDLHETFLRFLPTGSKSYNHDRKTLAALGRTCKGISNAALDILWEKLFSIDPILRLLPQDAYQKVQTPNRPGNWQFCLLRPLKEEDFVGFDRYAYRIRILDQTNFTNPSPGFSLLLSLKEFRDPLLPRLKEFLWHPDVRWGTIQAFLIISRSLPSHRFQLKTSRWDSIDHAPGIHDENVKMAVDMFKKPILTWIPDVTVLELQCGGYMSLAETLGALKGLSDLQSLVISYTIDSTIFNHLTALPNLRCMALRDLTYDIVAGSSQTVYFPALEEATIDGTFEAMRHFFMRLHSSQVKKIHLSLTNIQPLHESFIHLLVSRHTHTLLHFILYSNYGGDPGLSGDVDVLDVNQFRPLYACTQLHSFKIGVNARRVHLNDDTIAAMAKSWPLLHTLRFYPRRKQQSEWQTPEVTLYGLWPLVEHCPRLASLGIPVDARVTGPFPLIELFEKGESGRHPYLWTKNITFYYFSPCDNEHHVADFMRFAFPHLQGFRAGSPHRDDYAKWNKVKESMSGVDYEMRRLRGLS